MIVAEGGSRNNAGVPAKRVAQLSCPVHPVAKKIGKSSWSHFQLPLIDIVDHELACEHVTP